VTCGYPIAARDGHDFPRLIDERVPGVAVGDAQRTRSGLPRRPRGAITQRKRGRVTFPLMTQAMNGTGAPSAGHPKSRSAEAPERLLIWLLSKARTYAGSLNAWRARSFQRLPCFCQTRSTPTRAEAALPSLSVSAEKMWRTMALLPTTGGEAQRNVAKCHVWTAPAMQEESSRYGRWP
jgi:hypothetical protein